VVLKSTKEVEKEKEELSSLIELLRRTREEEAQWRIDNNVDELDKEMAELPRSHPTSSTTSTEEGREEPAEPKEDPKQEIVRGERTYPTRTKRPQMSPSLQEVADQGKGALIEPALTFGKGFQRWIKDRRQKDDAKKETKKSPKKQKIEVQDEKPTSSEILADQFVVEKPDERSSLEKLQQNQPDKRSILEKLEEEYEKEKRLEEKK
jgi:hypothetical protein